MSAATPQSLELWQLCGFVAGKEGSFWRSLPLNVFSAASWTIIVWDGIITLDLEVRHVWSMPRTAYVKWLYFFGKYFALAFQTVVIGFQVGYLATHATPLHYCRAYRFCEMVANTLLMLCFDAVLLLRIYALYGYRTWSSAFATAGVIIECVMALVSTILTIPNTLFDSACAMGEVPKTVFVYVVGTLVSQTILLWLAYRRREYAGRAMSSVACVTIRDGLLVFVCMAVFLTIIFITTLHNSPVTTLMIFWVPTVTSVATSRVILNLQTTSHRQTVEEFTTDIYGVYGSADSYILSDGPFSRPGPF